MALVKLDFFSEALGLNTSLYCVLPQNSVSGQIGIDQKSRGDGMKSILLLHGLSDDESIWLRRTSIERYAAEYGVAVIMPRGERSFYTNMKYGGRFYDHIAKEVPAVAREFFPISSKREDSYVAGLSMGGYGALKIALKENESFCAGAGLSSVTDIRARASLDFKGMNFYEPLIPVFGEEMNIPDSEDLFLLSTKKAQEEKKPRLYMAVGKNDFLYQDNLKFKAHLEALPFDFTYEEGPGIHNWEFWDEYIKKVLAWFMK